MAKKLSIDGQLIGTTAENVEYGKQGWPAASNLKTALDDLNTRLTEVELHGGGGDEDAVINVNGTWVSFGDSITALNNQQYYSDGNVTKGFQTRVMEKIRFSGFYNYGIFGAQSMYYQTQIDAMLENDVVPDYVTWLFGTNDLYNHGLSWLGTLDDYINKSSNSSNGPTKYYSAIRFFIDAIKEINPNVKIILCSIPRRGGGSVAEAMPHWYTPHKSVYQAQYAEAVMQVAAYESRVDAACDFFNEAGFYDYNLSVCTYDGTHPNDFGMQLLANRLIDVFKDVII